MDMEGGREGGRETESEIERESEKDSREGAGRQRVPLKFGLLRNNDLDFILLAQHRNDLTAKGNRTLACIHTSFSLFCPIYQDKSPFEVAMNEHETCMNTFSQTRLDLGVLKAVVVNGSFFLKVLEFLLLGFSWHFHLHRFV